MDIITVVLEKFNIIEIVLYLVGVIICLMNAFRFKSATHKRIKKVRLIYGIPSLLLAFAIIGIFVYFLNASFIPDNLKIVRYYPYFMIIISFMISKISKDKELVLEGDIHAENSLDIMDTRNNGKGVAKVCTITNGENVAPVTEQVNNTNVIPVVQTETLDDLDEPATPKVEQVTPLEPSEKKDDLEVL